ncbi:MAG: class I SAM-dependent methyltransferase [Verrucomicrobiae bacterium]|nr:class I SAM-dependent methyltransferase [Verrucomicrobiae bacterium]
MLRRLIKKCVREWAKWRFRCFPRSVRARCWCGGDLRPFPRQPIYGICRECGTYVNRQPLAIESLRRLYSFDLYWHARQRLKGHPVIEQRAAHDRGDGRVDFWIGLIKEHGPSSGQVVEVGCGSGVLLAELKRMGYSCCGVEPDRKTAEWVADSAGVEMVSGLFPDAPAPRCDLFLAMDVMEHSIDPLAFMRKAAQLLRQGGVAVIQTPIHRDGDDPPFGDRFNDAFDPTEHNFIFTDQAMRRLAELAGLRVIDAGRRLAAHHEICVFKADLKKVDN